MAEAKRFGFGEQNFGRGFEKEQKQLQADARRHEAQVSSTYDVRVKLETDTRGLVVDLVSQTKKLLAENNAFVQEQLRRECQASQLKMSERQSDQIRQLKK